MPLLKKPVAAAGGHDAVDDVYTTRLTEWKKCRSPLSVGHEVRAIRYGLDGIADVTHRTMRCNRKGCKTVYNYNFMWAGSKKINTVKHVRDWPVLFVNSKRCFSVDYLKYNLNLHYRGFLSMAAASWAYGATFGDEEPSAARYGRKVPVDFPKLHANAIMYYMALNEFAPLNLLDSLVIEEEVTADSLQTYNNYLHEHVFPPAQPASVKEIVGDGHEKVLVRCGHPQKRPGRPRADGTHHRAFTNGWFMLLQPQSGRILAAKEQTRPENNQDVAELLAGAVARYPKLNCFIYDRACSFCVKAGQARGLKQIKTWAVDRFHAKSHGTSCRCSPLVHRKIDKRLRGINTSVAEQTFAWLRGSARTFNEMRPLRHKFVLLAFARTHNAQMEAGDVAHLNRYVSHKSLSRRATRAYGCTATQ